MTDTHKAIVAAEVAVEPRREPEVHPMFRAVMASLGEQPSPEALREALGFIREYDAMEAKKAFDLDMVALQKALPRVLDRDKLVEFDSKRAGKVSYRHTTLAAAMDAVTSIIADHGFSFNWHPASTERSVSVTCRLTHRDGHFQESTLTSSPDTNSLRSVPQNIASTITLLQRYTLLALLGIATGDMQEPEGRRDAKADKLATKVEVAQCLNFLSRKCGVDKAEAELNMEKPTSEWTVRDLKDVCTWAKNRDGVES